MKIVTCVGYHGTGSGAVADYLKEFGIINFNDDYRGDFEFRLIFDPDGIMDLEYHLTKEDVRGNTSIAIKRFFKLVKMLNKDYSKMFKIDFYKISIEYINQLRKFQFFGWGVQDFCTFPYLKRKKLVLYKLFAFVFNRKKWKDRSNINPYKKEISYFTDINKNDFYIATKEYLNKIFSNVFCSDKINMLEQMTPTNNVENYCKFFDDIKVFIVDRDPRDCYIQYVLKKEHVYPNNVHEFCEMYKSFRLKSTNNSNLVCKIQFEDLIYEYENTTKKIRDFLGIDLSTYKNTNSFEPNKSIKNTRLFLKYPQFLHDVKIIEEELNDYLYDFPEL